jgi:hypothetical protein
MSYELRVVEDVTDGPRFSHIGEYDDKDHALSDAKSHTNHCDVVRVYEEETDFSYDDSLIFEYVSERAKSLLHNTPKTIQDYERR